MKSLQRTLLLGATSVAIFSVVSVAAFAQDIETITVTGVRESLRDSLVTKQNAELITENISTKDIGQLPDVTIAEELSRLPGLNTTLDRGNASQAAVRGLGPRLVLGLVNGREVASPEPDQNVRWEIYPSEVVSGVSVYKSQAANLLSGGIAATIDIQTVSPLDYSGSSFTLRAGPEYNEEGALLPKYGAWGGFRTSTAFITHLTDNLAIALSASFQRQRNGYSSFQSQGYNEWNSGNAGDVNGDGVIDSTQWAEQTEITEIQQDRTALTGAVDWRATPNLRLKFDALYSGYNIGEGQMQAWYGGNTQGDWSSATPGVKCSGATAWAYDCSTSSTNPNTIISDHAVVAATLDNSWSGVKNVIADYRERHTLLVAGFNAELVEGPWDAKLDLSHSEAARNNIWQSIYTDFYPQNMAFDVRAGRVPFVTISGSGTDVSNPNNQWTQNWDPGQSSGPEYTRDHISAAQFDAARTIEGSFVTSLDFGGRITDRSKNHENYSYNLCPGTGSWVKEAPDWLTCPATSYSIQLPAADLQSFKVHGFSVPDMVYGDYRQLAALVYPNTDIPADAEQLPDHWKVHESMYEAYAKVDIASNFAGVPMTGNIGVRLVDVKTTSSGYSNGSPISVSKGYTKFLPSMSLNFHVADDQVVRFAASIAMSRPPLDNLKTGYSLDSVHLTGSGGNPFLNPYMANQVDLSYEWYFHDESLFAAALYYKDLSSFIGWGTTQQVIGGTAYSMASPTNGKGGGITGLELTFQTRFYFLPGVLQDFGIYSNYAYVNSGVKEFTPVWNPLEGTGLAKHTGEFDLWYSKAGFEGRVAYKIHSPFTYIQGWNSQSLSRLDWERTLEASISYQWNEHIAFRLQGRNLTNSVSRSYLDNNPDQLARYDVFGRSYLFDISFKN